MGRIEVITRTERRRKYSPAERDAIMREADAPDVTVREVAESLIYGWRTARRQAEKSASEPLTFITYGTVPQSAVATPPAPQPARPDPVPTMPVMAEELTRPNPGARPGEIGINLPRGVRLSVDSYTEDGRLEIDNNLSENALRGIAVGRKNWLFAGADCGGERAAAIYSLLETAKLNDVNPQAWLADVLDRIGRAIPSTRLGVNVRFDEVECLQHQALFRLRTRARLPV